MIGKMRHCTPLLVCNQRCCMSFLYFSSFVILALASHLVCFSNKSLSNFYTTFPLYVSEPCLNCKCYIYTASFNFISVNNTSVSFPTILRSSCVNFQMSSNIGRESVCVMFNCCCCFFRHVRAC